MKVMSLRAIAAALSISHEAVRKRLKAIEGKGALTRKREQELTSSTRVKESVSPGSKAHKSRASRQAKHTVNRVSTSKTPAPYPPRVSTPWKLPLKGPQEA
jgi:predicted ArsR family transcriptional regulator